MYNISKLFNVDFIDDLEIIKTDIKKIIKKSLIIHNLKTCTYNYTALQDTGVTTIKINTGSIDYNLSNLVSKYNLYEAEIIVSPGIVHHVDRIQDKRYEEVMYILPIIKNEEYYIKYYSIEKGKEVEEYTEYFEPIIMASNKLHSLSPLGIKQFPFVALTIWF